MKIYIKHNIVELVQLLISNIKKEQKHLILVKFFCLKQ